MTQRQMDEHATVKAIEAALQRRRPWRQWRAIFVGGETAFALYMTGAQVQVIARRQGSDKDGGAH